jgi:hypothetical protein
MAFLIVLGLAEDQRKNREAVSLPGSFTHEPADGVRLEITSAQQPAAAEIQILTSVGTNLAAAMAEFSREIGGPLPTLFLVHRSDLKNGEIQPGELSAEQGVLLRANLLETNFSPQQLEREMVRHIIKARTNGRSEKEMWAWVADGFPHWWSARAGATNGLAGDPVMAAAARKAKTSIPAASGMFSRWFSVRRDAGQQGAEALSWAALQTLSTRHGRGVVLRLIRECFGAPVPKDVRGWVREKVHPPEQRLRRVTGMGFSQLAGALEQELAGQPPESRP